MSETPLAGSCLCGAVRYEVEPPFLRFAHCHCGRCRKATGTGHATNLYLLPERFRWTEGQDFVVRYDLPTAKSFSTTFCRQCGAPLPHHTRSGREMVVPAGSLDDLPDLRPQAHIFWNSRIAWGCAQGEAPAHGDLPDWWQPELPHR